MPEKKAPRAAAPAKLRAEALQPFSPEPDAGPVINSRSAKTKTSKMATGGKATADRLTLEPPNTTSKGTARGKKKEPSPDTEIIIQSMPPRPNPPTARASTRRASTISKPAPSRRPSSPTINGRPGRSQLKEPANFHESDRLPDISDAVRHEITGIFLIVIGLILLFGMMAQKSLIADAGMFVKRMFGVGAFIIPPLIVIMGVTFIWEGFTKQEHFNQTRITGLILMVVAFVSTVHLVAGNSKALAESGGGGGFFAYYINEFLSNIITGVGVFVLWLALGLVGLMLTLSMSLRDMGRATRNGYRFLQGQPPLVATEAYDYDEFDDFDEDEFEDFASFDAKRRTPTAKYDPASDDDLLDDLLLNNPPKTSGPRKGSLVPDSAPDEPVYTHRISLTPELPKPAEPAAKPGRPPVQQNWKRDETMAAPAELPRREWQIPSINILASFSDVEVNPQELRKKARLIENTLASFGVEAFVREVNTGPTVTQFALEPGIGVKVARITALANDLALALAAPAIRLEAPVPGQSRVGIEVPNNKVATVGLREIMEADEFARRSGKLKFALGRDVSGQPIVTDLTKMPHLLIAGSTGSGKSVCLNSIVAAYLLQYRPSELQFIMIDPKMVELSTYNGIPHLRFPVVTQIEADPEKERNRNDRTPTVMSVLKWTIREMERRYKQLSLYGHRNIDSFNRAAGNGNDLEKLPYLVLIVDELADLMMVAPEEAESAICRLAQKARAVGIHLILATQRPSVDVVTGLIKANFPSRITFAVTSQIDSRVILDMAGAEKLLGRGDMLYLASDAPKPIRVQGVYVGDEEIDTMVKHWRQQNEFLTGDQKSFVQSALWPQELQEIEDESNTDQSDELFEDALEIVREARTASTSLLQRRLRIGYNRAARLIEDLEQAGVIGQADGGRPRPVLLDEEDLNGPTSLTAAASAFEPVPEQLPIPSAQRIELPPRPDPSAPMVPRQNRPTDDFDTDPPI